MIKEVCFAGITEALHRRTPSAQRVQELLDKALGLSGLTYNEAGELLNITDPDLQAETMAAAGDVKEKIYGKRVVLFAPLYLSNECSNNCLYCGFRKENSKIQRRTISTAEAVKEASAIADMGHKRILLVCGEKPGTNGVDYVVEAIHSIYEKLDIRRINVNMAPLSLDGFKQLKRAGIGTYQLFQETYHPAAYAYYHPAGLKADYRWRFTSFDRAMQAGINDVGIGALFGLYDYRFEVMALIQHAGLLEQRWGTGPHTVSVPRLKQAPGSAVDSTPFRVTDRQLMMAVAVLRLALPYTGIILSTREPAALRDSLLRVGVSQISAGSSTAPGGYGNGNKGGGQFYLEDSRTLDEVVKDICQAGYLPSFCTACYRQERTGERFMALAKGGDIKELCQPNALMTFKEYLLDYSSAETCETGENILNRFMDAGELRGLKEDLIKRLADIEHGARDLYY